VSEKHARLAALDVWGASHTPADALIAATGLRAGQPWQDDLLELAWERVASSFDLLDLALTPVGYADERVFVTLDVVEVGGTAHHWREPQGEAVPPALAEVLGRYNETREAFWKLNRPVVERIDPVGHFASEDEALQRIEQQAALLLDADLDGALRATRDAADEALRAGLAYMLGWASDKQRVVGALLDALYDASGWVRHNAARALLPLALRAVQRRDLTLPLAPLASLLGVSSTHDRARAAVLLGLLAEDANVRAALRATSLPQLQAMAALRQPNNRAPALALLALLDLDSPVTIELDAERQAALLRLLHSLQTTQGLSEAAPLIDPDPLAPAHQQLADSLWSETAPELTLRLHRALPIGGNRYQALVALTLRTAEGTRQTAARYTVRWHEGQFLLWSIG
jgi:hypothetical protein